MAFDRQQMYLTWGGETGTDGEVWQCGLHLGRTDFIAPTLPSAAALQDLYEDTIQPFHSSAQMYVSAGARLLWAKAALLGTAGEYLDEPVIYEEAQPGTAGGSTGDSEGGPQCALAVSLWSGATFGQANYGRFYVPWNNAPVQTTDALINSTERTAIAAVVKTFLDEVNAWADSVSLASVVNMSQVGAGTTKVVTTARVGSVKDTQRRRRNRLNETYTNVTLA